MTPTDPQSQTGRSYAGLYLLLGVVAGEIFWFWLLYPHLPKTVPGWLGGALAGGGLGAWAGANAWLMEWLQERTRLRALCKVLAALVAVSLGATIFWLAQGGQAFILAILSDRGR